MNWKKRSGKSCKVIKIINKDAVVKTTHFLFLSFILLIFVISCIQPDSGKVNGEDMINDSLQDPVELLSRLIADDSTNADLFNQRAEYHILRNNINPAFRDVRKAIELNPGNASFYLTLANIYITQGDAVNCKKTLQKALELDPELVEAYMKLAELELILKDYEQVFSNLNRAIELESYNPTAYFIKGYTYLEMGDSSNAIKNFQLAADQDQQYFEAYFQLGLLFSARGNPLAIDYFNNALNINPQSPGVLYAKAMFYQEIEEVDKALEVYDMLLETDPYNKLAYHNIGYLYLVYINDFETASEYFTKAIETDPGYYEAYYNRGYAHELSGNYLDARKDYKKALELEANYSKAIEGLNRLDRISH